MKYIPTSLERQQSAQRENGTSIPRGGKCQGAADLSELGGPPGRHPGKHPRPQPGGRLSEVLPSVEKNYCRRRFC